jgi:hypothetical protein
MGIPNCMKTYRYTIANWMSLFTGYIPTVLWCRGDGRFYSALLTPKYKRNIRIVKGNINRDIKKNYGQSK